MTLERRKLSATTLACAAALAGFDADAQPARASPDCGGEGAMTGEVARVIDGKSFLLADGREVRLAAVETLSLVPGDEDDARVTAALAAKAALESAVLHREVTLRPTSGGPDRYGRLIAYVFVRTPSGETLAQREMLAAGQALVAPTPDGGLPDLPA